MALLEDPEFGVARAVRTGVDAMLDDYVAAHEAVRNASPQLISRLASGLTEVLARLAGQGVANLADTVHAVVGYRLDADKLNQVVMSRLSDPAYLARFVTDETARTVILIAFSHGQATRLRRLGDPESLEKARGLLLRAVSTEKDLGGLTTARVRSSVFYDLGYLDFLHGDHERALDSFERSRAAAEHGGDRTGAYISQLVGMRVGLLSGAVGSADYRAALEEALAYFTGDEARGPHAARWAMTIHGQFLDLALLLEDPELAAAELQAMEEAPWTQQAGRSDIVTKYRARVAAVVGDRAEACDLFSTLLRDELTGPPSHREELSRDLFYYGRALATVGDIAEARQVWDLGLRCPDNAANWPWKPKIAALMNG
jgi:tetratricopeptide (TPR) repeat protein